MNRSVLYLTIFVLVDAVSALVYFYYQEQKKASDLHIIVNDQGLSVQKK